MTLEQALEQVDWILGAIRDGSNEIMVGEYAIQYSYALEVVAEAAFYYKELCK